jgi:hypothetical protein
MDFWVENQAIIHLSGAMDLKQQAVMILICDHLRFASFSSQQIWL